MKIQEKYKNAMKQFKISDSVEERILKKVRTKEKSYFKIALASLSIMLLSVISISFVYAEEIKEYWQNVKVNFTHDNNENEEVLKQNFGYKKTLVDDIELDSGYDEKTNTNHYGYIDSYEKYGEWISLNKLESDLGIKLLKYDEMMKDAYEYTLLSENFKENKKVQLIRIRNPYLYYYAEDESHDATCTGNDACITMLAFILTQNANPNNYKDYLDGRNLAASPTYIETMEHEQFGKVLIYSNNSVVKDITATFTYDNVIYLINGLNKVTLEQIKDIINELHY